MKILIIQERGRHPSNREYRECECLRRAFERLGLEVDVCGLNQSTPYPKKADIVLVVENANWDWIPNLDQFGGVKLFWSIDSHCGLKKHKKFSKKFDITLCSNLPDVDKLNNGVWFPNCYPSDLIKPPKHIENKVPIGFCGNINNRKQWIRKLKKAVCLRTDIFVLGDAMVQQIGNYEIHWNRNISYDINYRTFETMGCKSLLITNITPGIDAKFTIGEHLVVYNNFRECVELIKFYTTHDQERLKIARAGHIHAATNHTYDNRAKELLKIVEGK